MTDNDNLPKRLVRVGGLCGLAEEVKEKKYWTSGHMTTKNAPAPTSIWYNPVAERQNALR